MLPLLDFNINQLRLWSSVGHLVCLTASITNNHCAGWSIDHQWVSSGSERRQKLLAGSGNSRAWNVEQLQTNWGVWGRRRLSLTEINGVFLSELCFLLSLSGVSSSSCFRPTARGRKHTASRRRAQNSIWSEGSETRNGFWNWWICFRSEFREASVKSDRSSAEFWHF